MPGLPTNAPDLRLIEVEESTATVDDRRKALGVEPGRIAKTLAIRAGEQLFLLFTRGDARLDNRKCKDEFGARPRMLGPEETLELTGHPVGGVCPFGLKQPACRSISTCRSKRSTSVYPAGGSLNTSVEVPTERLFELVGERWVDLCVLREEAAGSLARRRRRRRSATRCRRSARRRSRPSPARSAARSRPALPARRSLRRPARSPTAGWWSGVKVLRPAHLLWICARP